MHFISIGTFFNVVSHYEGHTANARNDANIVEQLPASSSARRNRSVVQDGNYHNQACLSA